MPPDPRAIHISTDGSCYKNPGGRSGCAAIVHYPDHLDREDEQIVDFGCEESSNNRKTPIELICFCPSAVDFHSTSSRYPIISAVGTSHHESLGESGYRDKKSRVVSPITIC
jgi:hypothetical protein